MSSKARAILPGQVSLPEQVCDPGRVCYHLSSPSQILCFKVCFSPEELVRFREGKLGPNPLAPSLPSGFCGSPLGASVSLLLPAGPSPAVPVGLAAVPVGLSAGLGTPAAPGAGGGAPPPSLAGGRCSSVCSAQMYGFLDLLWGKGLLHDCDRSNRKGRTQSPHNLENGSGCSA